MQLPHPARTLAASFLLPCILKLPNCRLTFSTFREQFLQLSKKKKQKNHPGAVIRGRGHQVAVAPKPQALASSLNPTAGRVGPIQGFILLDRDFTETPQGQPVTQSRGSSVATRKADLAHDCGGLREAGQLWSRPPLSARLLVGVVTGWLDVW